MKKQNKEITKIKVWEPLIQITNFWQNIIKDTELYDCDIKIEQGEFRTLNTKMLEYHTIIEDSYLHSLDKLYIKINEMTRNMLKELKNYSKKYKNFMLYVVLNPTIEKAPTTYINCYVLKTLVYLYKK